MNASPRSRAHLVERAVEAMSGVEQLAPRPPAPSPAVPAPASATVASPPPARPASPAAAITPPISLEAMAQAGLVVAPVGTTRNRISEEIAVVQHSLLRTLKAARSTDGRCDRIILVTSAKPGEGKTFMSLNLAASLAASGTRPVVLVDADGKHMSISRLLGHADSPGLRTLSGDVSRQPGSHLVPTAIERLSLLPYGEAPAGAPAIAPGQQVNAALLRLAASLPQHLIILDTPPCLSTSDPGALATIAGQVLMVVEAEHTQRNEVEAALDMVEACPTLQLVLNRAVLTPNDTFGAYGGYDAYGAPPAS